MLTRNSCSARDYRIEQMHQRKYREIQMTNFFDVASRNQAVCGGFGNYGVTNVPRDNSVVNAIDVENSLRGIGSCDLVNGPRPEVKPVQRARAEVAFAREPSTRGIYEAANVALDPARTRERPFDAA